MFSFRSFATFLMIALLSIAFTPSSDAQFFKKKKKKIAAPVGQPKLQPGEYDWHPERSRKGPLLLVISIDDQIAYVYRNGVQIGRSTVSTGKKGNETPTGVFSILQKNKDHESSIYKGAKMPNMQRLTWSGIALHAGHLPGYPASHGCIRLPFEFSELVFAETTLGATVVISKRSTFPSTSKKPASILLASEVGQSSIPVPNRKPFWEPSKSPEGPVALLVSTADQTLYVYRNGILIGQAPVGFLQGEDPLPGGVFLMLEGTVEGGNPLVPGRVLRPWTTLSLESKEMPRVYPMATLRSRLRINPDFAKLVYEIMSPGALLVVTHKATSDKTRSAPGFTIMNQDAPAPRK